MREWIDLAERLRNPSEIADFKQAFNDPKIVSRVQSQAARKNPSWKKSLVKSMLGHDFHLVGTGVNGAVFQNPKYPFVLKVYRQDTGFDEWLHFARTHSNNIYVPKLKGTPVRLNNIFTVVRMESLVACPIDKAIAFTDEVERVQDLSWRDRSQLDSVEPQMREIAQFMRDWEPVGDLSPHNVMCRENGEVVIIDPLYIEPGKSIDW